jgi:chromosome segregation ATPase
VEIGRKDQKIEELKKTADRRFKGMVAIGILALLSTGYGVFIGRQKQETIEQKEGELQNALKEKEILLENIALLKDQYESIKSRFSDALKAKDAMGEETARLRGEIEKIMKVLEAKDQEILTKTGELRVLMDRLAEVVRESDKLQLRIQEQNRQMEILKIQLESGSIDPIEVDTAEKIAALRAELEQKSNELAIVSGQLEAQNLLLTENMKTIEFLNERIETLSSMLEVKAKIVDEQSAELDRLRELDPNINGIARHVQLINKFRAGEELTPEEKEYLIDYYEERIESMKESFGMILREASNQLSRSLEENSAMYRRSTAGNTNSAELRQAMADLQMANDAASIAYKLTMSTYWDERREAEAELKLLKTLDK